MHNAVKPALVCLVLSVASWATISPDAGSVPSSGVQSGTTLTWNHTMGAGSNGVLVVLVDVTDNVQDPNGLISGVTFNGVAMKRLPWTRDFGGSEMNTFIYILTAPASGTHAITVTFKSNLTTSGSVATGAAESFTGVHQTYPYRLPVNRGSGLTSGTAVSVTSPDAISGDYVVGVTETHASTVTNGGSQTSISIQNGMGVAGTQAFAAAYVPAATSTTLQWTQGASDVWSTSAVALRPDTDTPTMPFLDYREDDAGGTAVSSVAISNVASSGCTNGLLFVKASYYEGTTAKSISSATWNSLSLTKLDNNERISGSNRFNVEWWYLKNPSSATSTLTVNFSGSTNEIVVGATTYCLVDQSSTFGTVAKAQNNTAAASFSVSVTSTATSLVEDIAYIDGSVIANALSAGTGSLLLHDVNAVNSSGGLSQVEIGATTRSMAWTIGSGTTAYNMMGVGINFNAGGGATVIDSSNGGSIL